MKVDPNTGKVIPNQIAFCIFAITYSGGLAECQELQCPGEK
jgi:hypothetical protein